MLYLLFSTVLQYISLFLFTLLCNPQEISLEILRIIRSVALLDCAMKMHIRIQKQQTVKQAKHKLENK